MRDAYLWRLIQSDFPPKGESNIAAWNMAVDACLFEQICSNGSPPILRLYQWDRFAVTVGRFQRVEQTVHLPVLKELQLTAARRPTGGRGILHGDDLTVGLMCSLTHIGLQETASVSAIYTRISTGIIPALSEIGIDAAQGNCVRECKPGQNGNCFASNSRADIIDSRSNRKLVGAALQRRGANLLMQASIPLHQNYTHRQALAASVFAGDEPCSAAWSSLDINSLSQALINALGATYSADFVECGLYPTEYNRSKELLSEHCLDGTVSM